MPSDTSSHPQTCLGQPSRLSAPSPGGKGRLLWGHVAFSPPGWGFREGGRQGLCQVCLAFDDRLGDIWRTLGSGQRTEAAGCPGHSRGWGSPQVLSGGAEHPFSVPAAQHLALLQTVWGGRKAGMRQLEGAASPGGSPWVSIYPSSSGDEARGKQERGTTPHSTLTPQGLFP